jgi:aminomethyltransferase
MAADKAITVFDALMEGGKPFDIKPAGMLALDVARIEAGLLLIEVDFFGSRKAMIPAQTYSPYELGMSRLVNLDKGRFIGQRALRAEHQRGAARQIVGLEIDWNEVEKLYDAAGLAPAVAATASRVATPVYRNSRQVGKATSTTWSPVLKRMIALATIERPHYADGTVVQFEMTVEAVRHRVSAKVVKTPFFNPARKTATPPA